MSRNNIFDEQVGLVKTATIDSFDSLKNTIKIRILALLLKGS
jgi:hypothetical protein